jgi:hypothetical protein
MGPNEADADCRVLARANYRASNGVDGPSGAGSAEAEAEIRRLAGAPEETERDLGAPEEAEHDLRALRAYEAVHIAAFAEQTKAAIASLTLQAHSEP